MSNEKPRENVRVSRHSVELVQACRKVLENVEDMIDGRVVSRTQWKGRHLELTEALAKARGGR